MFGMQAPGQQAVVTTKTNQFLWGDPDAEVLSGDFVISSDARDAGNTPLTTVLRPGLMMGKVTATGELKEFDVAATDGTQTLVGYLKTEVSLVNGFYASSKGFAPVIIKAPVKAKYVLYKGVTIIGHASESAIRAQIRRRSILDDEATAQPTYTVNSQQFTVLAADVTAGKVLLPAVSGLKYRITDITLTAIGGNASGSTAVILTGAQSGTVNLFTVAVAALTQSAIVKPNSANVTVLADGASLKANDASGAISIGKTGGSLAGATSIQVTINYVLEQ